MRIKKDFFPVLQTREQLHDNADRVLIEQQVKAYLDDGGKIQKIPTGYGATTGDVYIDGRLKNPTTVKDKKVQLYALSKEK